MCSSAGTIGVSFRSGGSALSSDGDMTRSQNHGNAGWIIGFKTTPAAGTTRLSLHGVSLCTTIIRLSCRMTHLADEVSVCVYETQKVILLKCTSQRFNSHRCPCDDIAKHVVVQYGVVHTELSAMSINVNPCACIFMCTHHDMFEQVKCVYLVHTCS